MTYHPTTDEITCYLNQILVGYEIIPANFGWHIHQGDTYWGILQYQETKGWQGSAFSHLPTELKNQLKALGQSSYSMLKVVA